VKTVKIHPASDHVSGEARVPYSKPHMQRAILLSLLTNAPSIVVHPAWSSEATALFTAAQRFGLGVMHSDPVKLAVTGVGKSLRPPSSTISAEGSALNFRSVAALACLSPHDTVLEGNASIRARPVIEHLNFVSDLGGQLEDISDTTHLRIRVRGSRRLGGRTTVETRHSSQVLTSVLLISPLADRPVTIHRRGGGDVGEGYVDLTISMMEEQGAVVERHGGSFVVPPAAYQSRLHHMASDFTALSYLAGVVASARDGQVTVLDYYPSSLSSEAQFVTTLTALGIRTSHDPLTRALRIERAAPATNVIEIDGRNIPTVVPTLAAIAPFIDARVSVRNASHVNNHKCRRLAVMIRELGRMGCRVAPLYTRDGALDGFETTGPQRPAGGVTLTSGGDHRIFLSLATAAIGSRRPVIIDGYENLHASYPEFLGELARLGVRTEVAEPGTATAGAVGDEPHSRAVGSES
jgi:3-phosphoshikimate 1-carboxyvinyltransferase